MATQSGQINQEAKTNLRIKKEKVMKMTRKATLQNHASAALALLALFAPMASSATATPRPAKPVEQPVTVIAHLLLPGAPASQMFVQEHGGKQYLYVEQASKEGFTIVTSQSRVSQMSSSGWPGRMRLPLGSYRWSGPGWPSPPHRTGPPGRWVVAIPPNL